MNTESLQQSDIGILLNEVCQLLLQGWLRYVVNHLSTLVNKLFNLTKNETYLWRVIQDRGIHTLIWQPPNRVTAEIREEIDPMAVISRCAYLADMLLAQAILTQDLQGTRIDGVSFRSSQPLRITFNDQ